MENKIINNNLKDIVNSLPSSPGVYQYYDKFNNLIYVGKAKNLKKRVKSYFIKIHDNYKTNLMVKKIEDIKYIQVSSESDALFLENNLIKEYQPKYNILLKDDKTYPWICIKNENYPRVFLTRNKLSDNSLYFGPYTSLSVVKTVLELITQIFKLRNCAYILTENNIKKNKFKVCLEYYIGNCDGPCIGKQNEQDYLINIDGIKNILKGNVSIVKNYLHEIMQNFSMESKFEYAQKTKEKIELIEKYQSKTVIVSPINNNIDVFTIVDDEDSAFVNYIKIIKGAVIKAHNVEIKKKLNEPYEEILPIAIIEIRNRMNSDSKEIIIPFNIEYKIKGIKFTVPKIGDKLYLLQLSLRNAKAYKSDVKRIQEKINPQKHINRILETIKKDLSLKELPRRIECFDNSNIQGKFPVGSCVVFENAKPKKSEYRHYNIKSVIGPNDYASIEEVVYRRYKRLIEEGIELPNLIVIDGGKGQLSSAAKSLKELNIYDKITVIGIAKKLEEIYIPEGKLPIYINKKSETLKVIQHIRDEAHRFGITFHKKIRSKDFIKSELKNIKGIGDITIKQLFLKFKTIDRIKTTNLNELKEIVGAKRAINIFEYFKCKN